MKTLTKLFVLLITTTIFAQNSIEKEVGEFSTLKVYDLIDVELIKSDHNKAEITGINANDVIINNKNGTLKIKMSIDEIFDGNNIKVKLYYTAFDVIDVNEGAKVHSKDDIKQFEVDLKAQEGGIINVPVNVTYTNVKTVTGGIVTSSGKSKSQDISVSTGGEYHGENLKTNTTEVSIKAGGEAYVNASKLVNIKIRAGGDVFVYGNPETVNESKALGGRVKLMNE